MEVVPKDEGGRIADEEEPETARSWAETAGAVLPDEREARSP